MFLCRSSRLHVIVWCEVKSADRSIDTAVGKRSFGFSRANRCIADTEISQPDVGEPFAIAARAGCEADDRVIAMAACELGKSNSRVLIGGRYPDGGEHVLRSQCGLEQALKEILRLDRAFALGPHGVDFAIERQQAGRQFGRRICKSNRTAKRAPIPDRGMADVRYRACDQRRVPGDDVGAFSLRMTGEAADLNSAAFDRNTIEASKA